MRCCRVGVRRDVTAYAAGCSTRRRCESRRSARRRRLSPRRSRQRRGVVLVAVIALLVLSGALIAGAFAAARGTARATRSARAGIIAQAAARRAIARTLSVWSTADDSLRIGAFAARALAESSVVAIDSADVRVRVQRLSELLYVVAAEVSVPSARSPLARRRMRVLIERAPTIDTTTVQPLRPIARWASADLY